MFLSNLIERNPAFAAVVIDLHQAGELPADCYVLDLDTMAINGELICTEAHKYGVDVIAMTKQFGRHPAALDTLRRSGVDSFVAVDMTCARAIHRAGQPLGNIGHLVQVPTRDADEAVAMRPANWTVFSMAKAEQAALAAARANTEQALLARIYGSGDVVVDSHAGGFGAAGIVQTAEQLHAFDGGVFAGVCSYPALIFDREEHVVVPTPNLTTLERARKELEAAGWQDVRVNAPGETSTVMISTLASAGATQVEPGHGFTATGAYHAFADLPERPAMVYLSEVSHTDADTSFCFGGGLYLCVGSVDYTPTAIVGSTFDEAVAHRVEVTLAQQHQEIDFYGRLAAPGSGRLNVGDSVVFCFRAQAFYTRSLVAAVAGVHEGKPTVQGICTPDGRPV